MKRLLLMLIVSIKSFAFCPVYGTDYATMARCQEGERQMQELQMQQQRLEIEGAAQMQDLVRQQQIQQRMQFQGPNPWGVR